jgi:hypothetical protein
MQEQQPYGTVVLRRHRRGFTTEQDSDNGDDQTSEALKARLLYQPPSDQALLACRNVLRDVEGLQRHPFDEDAWCSQVPRRVGHSHTLDLTIEAFYKAITFGRTRCGGRETYRAIGRATSALRQSIEEASLSEETLAAIAGMILFETFLTGQRKATTLHLEGMIALVRAREKSDDPRLKVATPFARSVLQYYSTEVFVASCVRGRASPLEGIDPSYYEHQHFDVYTQVTKHPSTTILRGLSDTLLIRLPALIARARAARQQKIAPIDALQLVDQLLEIEDQDAEDDILHHCVSVKPTQDAQDSIVTPFSLMYTYQKDFGAAGHYWFARLLLYRLHFHLRQLVAQYDPEYNAPDPCPNIETTMARYFKNLLMSSPYCRLGPSGAFRRFHIQLIITLWGVLKDFPSLAGIIKSDPSGAAMLMLRGWLLSHAKADLAHGGLLLDFTANDMDQTADIFVGGPLEGSFVNMYGLEG